jgi:hypothetical protein
MKIPSLFSRKKEPEMRNPGLMEGQNEYAFRRSRTLTGSVSSEVRAAAESRSQLKTPRLKLQDLHALRRKLMIRLGMTLLAALFLVLLIAQFIGLTQNVTYAVAPTKTPATSEYLATIHQYFVTKPFEQFAFSVNDKNLSNFVAAKHAEVASVTITEGSKGYGFGIQLRQPLLSWNANKGQFYVDGQGVAFEKNYFAEPALTVSDESGITPETAGAVVSGRFIRFLGQLVGAVNQHNIGAVTQIRIPPNATHQLDIRLEGKGYTIKTNIDRDPNGQAEDIANAVKHIEGDGKKPEYIDARVEGKAFYR